MSSTLAYVEEHPVKKPRLDTTSDDLVYEINTTRSSLSCNSPEEGASELDNASFPFHEFTEERVLFTDPRSKTVCVLGSCGATKQQGIVVAEKQPLTKSSLPSLFSKSSRPEKKFQNDVYSQYVLDCKEGGLGELRVTTVYPATDEHVKKYEAQKRRCVLETPADYQEITKPFAEQQSLSLDVCESSE